MANEIDLVGLSAPRFVVQQNSLEDEDGLAAAGNGSALCEPIGD